ncbi:AraC family transcriptional regulator [Paenibacillus aestuarii]|uniref:AraC family transcriptional regulator n=1 Tax=Paenibacillus aestuarii TaxID=516965 RepID=A0ABW0K758_9BACL|nr:AraC family transcriptional regulator [Paenibacillus aestuarii]
MTHFPEYLKTYPNMDTSSPLHIKVNRLHNGYRAHRHDYLEFSYVLEGSGSEVINNVRHPMVPGTFTFVLPYQVHEIFTDPGSTLVLFNCEFSMDLLMEPGQHGDLSSLIKDFHSLQSYAQFAGSDKERMEMLIKDMHEAYNGDELWRRTFLQIKLKEILIRFDRFRRSSEAAPVSDARDARQPSKVSASTWPIIHYIHRNYQEELTLSDLAAKFSMSMSRISEVIKQTTGQTFVHFLHDLRLRHACSLLVSTDMSVIEIAHEVGYGSYKTFSHIFRETKGLPPKDYRKLKVAMGGGE